MHPVDQSQPLSVEVSIGEQTSLSSVEERRRKKSLMPAVCVGVCASV